MTKRAIYRNPSRESRQSGPPVAHAPYNFIPLPDEVAKVNLEELAPHDRYLTDKGHFTGRIECRLETHTPLFIRGQMPLDEFSKPDQDKKNRSYKDSRPGFYRDPATGQPMIPGSSLRGMLRTMVEIVSYGKFVPVSNRAVYYRSVADKTSIRQQYKESIESSRTGWIVEDQDGFAIRPVPEVAGRTFYRVSDKFAQAKGIPFVSIFDTKGYMDKGPQIVDVYFLRGDDDRVVDISAHGGLNFVPGAMICSGLMGDPLKKRSKKNHWVIPKVNKTSGEQLLRISDEIVADIKNSITEYQKTGDLDKENGPLQDGMPVFFVTGEGESVIAIGHTANFRLPYLQSGSQIAARLRDMVPDDLQDPNDIDFAEALFGYAKSSKVFPGKARAYAGRVQVGHAKLSDPAIDPWLASEAIIPKILSSPKPTSYQHYLTQPTPDELRWKDNKNQSRRHVELTHYGSAQENAEPRGYKGYWHQASVQSAKDFQADPEEVEDHKTQYTRIQPVKAGTSFQFTLHFQNLTQVELGALLWALRLPGNPDDKRYHRLGMGKPLGLGSVEIQSNVILDDRLARYQNLWDTSGGWACPDEPAQETFVTDSIDAFEIELMRRIGKAGQKLQQQPRIQMLQALLTWPGPGGEFTSYMTIEPENEYKDRPVLPDPLHLNGLSRPDPAAIPDRPRRFGSDDTRRPKSGEDHWAKNRQTPGQQSKPKVENNGIPELREEPSEAAKDIFAALFGDQTEKEDE